MQIKYRWGESLLYMAVSLLGVLPALSMNTSTWRSHYLKGQFFGCLTKICTFFCGGASSPTPPAMLTHCLWVEGKEHRSGQPAYHAKLSSDQMMCRLGVRPVISPDTIHKPMWGGRPLCLLFSEYATPHVNTGVRLYTTMDAHRHLTHKRYAVSQGVWGNSFPHKKGN